MKKSLSSKDDRALRRYLLGQLAEEEQSRVEERLFTERSFLDEISAAEDDLVVDYVGGGLSATDRQQFEAFYLVNPERRRNVRLTRTLQEEFGETRDLAPAGAGGPSPRRLPWLMAAASLVIACGVAGYAVLRIGEEREMFSQHERQWREQLTNRDSQIAQLAGRQQAAQKPPGGREPATAGSEDDRTLISLVLVPDFVARGRGETPRRKLSVPRTMARLQFHLKLSLPADQQFESYRATLENREGETVWSGERLHAAGIGRNRRIVLNLPPRALQSDDYRITLYGRTAAGAVEDIDEYSFEVVAR